MGLYDFVAGIGKKLFKSPEDAPAKLKGEIEDGNLGITELKVDYNNGVVLLSGQAPDQAAMEKAVLIAGNTENVTKVDISNLKTPSLSEKVEYYVIERGDNLSKIAKKFLGDANRYNEIFSANKEVIKDADLIYPGQKIRIPLEN